MATASFPWVDALLNGNLEALLVKLRSEGKSVRKVAEEISDLLPGDYEVQFWTVARWCADRDIPKGEKAA